jgi:hypothetical protein
MTSITEIIEENRDRVLISTDEFSFSKDNMMLEIDYQVGILRTINIPPVIALSLAVSVGARQLSEQFESAVDNVMVFAVEPSSFFEDADFTSFNSLVFSKYSRKHLFF